MAFECQAQHVILQECEYIRTGFKLKGSLGQNRFARQQGSVIRLAILTAQPWCRSLLLANATMKPVSAIPLMNRKIPCEKKNRAVPR